VSDPTKRRLRCHQQGHGASIGGGARIGQYKSESILYQLCTYPRGLKREIRQFFEVGLQICGWVNKIVGIPGDKVKLLCRRQSAERMPTGKFHLLVHYGLWCQCLLTSLEVGVERGEKLD
jgi:hypothetical protein